MMAAGAGVVVYDGFGGFAFRSAFTIVSAYSFPSFVKWITLVVILV